MLSLQLQLYGHDGFLAAKDISEEVWGKITYPVSEKQKSAKMLVICGLP